MSAAAPFRELQTSAYRGFVGGLNLRDAIDELAPSESPDLYNVVLDERGGFGSRLGYVKQNPSPYHASNKVVAIFAWPATPGHLVTQVGPSLYLDNSTTAFKTFTTSARCGFAEFAGKLYIIHPADGLFASDGTSGGTTAVASGPKGSTLAVWQNRLWASGNSARVYFSSIGTGAGWTPASTTTAGGSLALPAATVTVASTAGFDPTGAITIGTGATADTVQYTGVTATTFTGCTGGSHTWPNGTPVTQGNNYNDLIEKDEEPVLCLRGSSGQDIIGQPGLIAFKLRSTYRINDSDTGAYTTLDPMIGAASNAAAAVVSGRVYSISEVGIAYTDGRGPMKIESDKLRPMWDNQQLAFDQLPLWCAGRKGQHLVFSVPTTGKTANDLAMEHYPAANPRDAATVIGSNAASCYAAHDDDLLAGSPTVAGQVYKQDTGGTDDGTPIHAYYQTAWITPHAERMSRIRSMLYEGHGAFTAFTRIDYLRAQGDPRIVTIGGGGAFVWNSGWKWNDGSTWGPDSFAGYSDPEPSLGTCKAISFRCDATTTDVKTTPGLSGSPIRPIVGSWAVYAIHLKSVPLRQL